jgi:hypothetical protein
MNIKVRTYPLLLLIFLIVIVLCSLSINIQ